MADRQWKKKSSRKNSYDQNDGVAGVVYILGNRALAWNSLKIGCSRHSGKKRAEQLNKDAHTGMPAQYRCLFEQKTLDCGLAEKRVFAKLKDCRVGKDGQEFFKIDYKEAKAAVIEECKKVDAEIKKKNKPRPTGTRLMLGRYNALKESK